jgi:IclR family transcriptional regulator, pca regulon regulatory protein
MTRLRPADADKRQARGSGPDFLEALARGIGILSAFNAERRQMSLSDVARVADLPRATVRRSLHTLEQLGYLESDGRLFRLTPKVLGLAAAYLGSGGNAAALQLACDRLCTELDEACSAAVLDGGMAVMIAHASPPRFLSSAPGIGFRVPAYCSALGRVLAAGLDEAARKTLFGTVTPTALTPRTVTATAELLALVEKAARDGYALSDQEVELGFRSIAVPVHRFDDRVVAALNIGVRIERATPKQIRELFFPPLQKAAEELRLKVV